MKQPTTPRRQCIPNPNTGRQWPKSSHIYPHEVFLIKTERLDHCSTSDNLIAPSQLRGDDEQQSGTMALFALTSHATYGRSSNKLIALKTNFMEVHCTDTFQTVSRQYYSTSTPEALCPICFHRGAESDFEQLGTAPRALHPDGGGRQRCAPKSQPLQWWLRFSAASIVSHY